MRLKNKSNFLKELKRCKIYKKNIRKVKSKNRSKDKSS